jgi:hypothetical protein
MVKSYCKEDERINKIIFLRRRNMKKIKTYTIKEEENTQREEWCSNDKETKSIDDCSVSLEANGLSPAEMKMIASEFRKLLKTHGYDVPMAT